MSKHINKEIEALKGGIYKEDEVEHLARNPCPRRFRIFYEHAMVQRTRLRYGQTNGKKGAYGATFSGRGGKGSHEMMLKSSISHQSSSYHQPNKHHHQFQQHQQMQQQGLQKIPRLPLLQGQAGTGGRGGMPRAPPLVLKTQKRSAGVSRKNGLVPDNLILSVPSQGRGRDNSGGLRRVNGEASTAAAAATAAMAAAASVASAGGHPILNMNLTTAPQEHVDAQPSNLKNFLIKDSRSTKVALWNGLVNFVNKSSTFTEQYRK